MVTVINIFFNENDDDLANHNNKDNVLKTTILYLPGILEYLKKAQYSNIIQHITIILKEIKSFLLIFMKISNIPTWLTR